MELATLGIIAAAAGAGVSAYGQIQQGRQQKAMGEYANEGAEIQARQARLDEIANNDIMARQRQARIGKMASQIAASGAGFEGTPLFLLEEANTAMLTEKSRISQQSASRQASLLQAGGIAKAEGLMARKAGYGNAAGSLLSGAGKTFSTISENKKD